MDNLAHQIGRRLRELRESRGLTQITLAERCGKRQSWLSKIELGERQEGPSAVELLLLASALDCPVGQLLGDESGYVLHLRDNAAPFEPAGYAVQATAKDGKPLVLHTISDYALDQLGLYPGDAIGFDISAEAVEAARTGDVVLVQALDIAGGLSAHTLIRQLVAPNLLITNSSRGNQPALYWADRAEKIAPEFFEAHVRGVSRFSHHASRADIHKSK